jgi:hypothetical protein
MPFNGAGVTAITGDRAPIAVGPIGLAAFRGFPDEWRWAAVLYSVALNAG